MKVVAAAAAFLILLSSSGWAQETKRPPAGKHPGTSRGIACEKIGATPVPFPVAPSTPIALTDTDRYLGALSAQLEEVEQQLAVMQQQITMMTILACENSHTLEAIREAVDTQTALRIGRDTAH